MLCPPPWPRFPPLTFHLCLGARQVSPSVAAANTVGHRRDSGMGLQRRLRGSQSQCRGSLPRTLGIQARRGLVASSGISRQGGGLLLRALGA